MSTVTSSSHVSASFVSVPASVHDRIIDDHNNNNKIDTYDKDNVKFVENKNVSTNRIHKMRKSTFKPTPLIAFSVAVSCASVHQINRFVNSSNLNVVNTNNLNNYTSSGNNALRSSFNAAPLCNPRSPTSFMEISKSSSSGNNNNMTNSILQTLHNGSIIDYLTSSSVNINPIGVNSKSFGHVMHDKVSSTSNTSPNSNCNEKSEMEELDNHNDAYWVHLLLSSSSVISTSSTIAARTQEDHEQESELTTVQEHSEEIQHEKKGKEKQQMEQLHCIINTSSNSSNIKEMQNSINEEDTHYHEEKKIVKEQQQVAQVRVLWVEFVQLFRFIRSVVPKFRIVNVDHSDDANNANTTTSTYHSEHDNSTDKGNVYELGTLLCEEDARQLGLHSTLSSFASCCYSESEESPLSLSSYVLHSSTFSPTSRNVHSSFVKNNAIEATSQTANVNTKKETNSTTINSNNKNKPFEKHTISNKRTSLPNEHNVPASPTATKGNFVIPNSTNDMQNNVHNKDNNDTADSKNCNVNSRSNSEIITSSQREQRRQFMELYLNAAMHNNSVNLLRELQSFVGYHTFVKNEEMEFINDNQNRESVETSKDYRNYDTSMVENQYSKDNNILADSSNLKNSSKRKSSNVFSFSFATSPPIMSISLRSSGAKSNELNFITNACRSNSSNFTVSGNDIKSGEINTKRQVSSASYEGRLSHYKTNRQTQTFNLAQSAPERSPLIPTLQILEEQHVQRYRTNSEKDKNAKNIGKEEEKQEHNVYINRKEKHRQKQQLWDKHANHNEQMVLEEKKNVIAQEEEYEKSNSEDKQLLKKRNSTEKQREWEHEHELEEQQQECLLNASVSVLSQPGFPLSNGYVSDDNDDSSLCEAELHSDKRLELPEYKTNKTWNVHSKEEKMQYCDDTTTHANSTGSHAKCLHSNEDKCNEIAHQLINTNSSSIINNNNHDVITYKENKIDKEDNDHIIENSNLISTNENRETSKDEKFKEVERHYRDRQRERRRKKSRSSRQKRVEAMITDKMSLLEECFKMLDERQESVISIDKVTLFMLCATDFTFQSVLRSIHCIDTSSTNVNTNSLSCSPSLQHLLIENEAITQKYENDTTNKIKLNDWLQNILNETCTKLETDSDKAHSLQNNIMINGEEHVNNNNIVINNNEHNLLTRRELITFEQFIKLVQRVLLRSRELCHELKKTEKDKNQNKENRVDVNREQNKQMHKEKASSWCDHLMETEEKCQRVKPNTKELAERHPTLLSISAPLSLTQDSNNTILSMSSSALTTENDNNTFLATKKVNFQPSSQAAHCLSKLRNTTLCDKYNIQLRNSTVNAESNDNNNIDDDENKKRLESLFQSTIKEEYEVKLTTWIDHFWLVQYAVIYTSINEIINGESQRSWREQLHNLKKRVFCKNTSKWKLYHNESKYNNAYIVENSNKNYQKNVNTDEEVDSEIFEQQQWQKEEEKNPVNPVDELNVNTLFDKMTLEEKDELQRLYYHSTTITTKQECEHCEEEHNGSNNEDNKQCGAGVVEQHVNFNANNNINSIIIHCGNLVQYSVNQTQLINLLHIICSANLSHAVSEIEVQRWLVLEPFIQHINFTFAELCAILDVMSRRVHFSELLRCLHVTSSTTPEQSKIETQQNVNVLTLFAHATISTLPEIIGQLEKSKKDVINENFTNNATKQHGIHKTTKMDTKETQLKMQKQEIGECGVNDNNNKIMSKRTSTEDSIEVKLKELIQTHQRRVNNGNVMCANCDYMKQQYNEHKNCIKTLQAEIQTLHLKVQELTSQLESKSNILETVEENLTETKRLLADAELREAELYDLLDEEHHAQLSTPSLLDKTKTDEIAKLTSQVELTEKLECIYNKNKDEDYEGNDKDEYKSNNGNNTNEKMIDLRETGTSSHVDAIVDDSKQNSNNRNEKEKTNVIACEEQRNEFSKSSVGDVFNAICPVWLQSKANLKKTKMIMPYVIKESENQEKSNSLIEQCKSTEATKTINNTCKEQRHYIHDGRVLTHGQLTYDFTSIEEQEAVNSSANLSITSTLETDNIAGLQIDLFNISMSLKGNEKEKITLRCGSGERRVSLMLYKSELYILNYTRDETNDEAITGKSKVNKHNFQEQEQSSLAFIPAKHAAHSRGSNNNSNKYYYFNNTKCDNLSDVLTMLRLRGQFTPYPFFNSSSQQQSEEKALYEGSGMNAHSNYNSCRKDNFSFVKMCAIEPQCWYRIVVEFQWDDSTCRVHVQLLSSEAKKIEETRKVEDSTHTCDASENNSTEETNMINKNNEQNGKAEGMNAQLTFGPFHLLPLTTTCNAIDRTKDKSDHDLNTCNKSNSISSSYSSSSNKWSTRDYKEEHDVATIQEQQNNKKNITQMEIHPR